MPSCFDCGKEKMEAQFWEIVKGESDVCLQVDLMDPKSGRKIRALAPLPVPVWVCTRCGRVEKRLP